MRIVADLVIAVPHRDLAVRQPLGEDSFHHSPDTTELQTARPGVGLFARDVGIQGEIDDALLLVPAGAGPHSPPVLELVPLESFEQGVSGR